MDFSDTFRIEIGKFSVLIRKMWKSKKTFSCFNEEKYKKILTSYSI